VHVTLHTESPRTGEASSNPFPLMNREPLVPTDVGGNSATPSRRCRY
jgi:hypothetical protein